MPDQVYVATQSGSAEVNGEPVVFLKGVTMVTEGHPLLTSVPDYFQPVEEKAGFDTTVIVHHAPESETTTVSFEATEAAIELATAHDIDLSTVTGSGKDGNILVGDVEAAIVAKGDGETEDEPVEDD